MKLSAWTSSSPFPVRSATGNGRYGALNRGCYTTVGDTLQVISEINGGSKTPLFVARVLRCGRKGVGANKVRECGGPT